ncbi:MAG: two-component system sensor histidine kinase RstB [Alteromonadaceae bacterium]|jgi:two-component system sensor histidine kinase RstB
MGLFLAVFLIIFLISIGTYYVSKYRISQHVHQNYGGTFTLISEGISRHQAEQQVQWLKAIENLSDLKFEQVNATSSLLSSQQLTRLKINKFIFNINPLLSAGTVYILSNNDNYLRVELSDFGSSLVRLTSFLMLNELGRHKSEKRILALENLRSIFNYPIQLKLLDSLHLPDIYRRNVKKGNISVVLKNTTTNAPSLIAYAPLGNSPYALVLGEIPFFDWFPLSLILIQLFCILVLMAATSYFLVKPLENRLEKVDKQVEKIAHDKGLSMRTPSGVDAIDKLSKTVNTMSIRIHKLIDDQDEMIRAISHELRTPITRIRFRMAIIDDQENQELSIQINGVERDLNELEKLIDEVLTFSKLKRDLPFLNIEKISIESLFNDLSNSAKLINANITIKVMTAGKESITADKRYMFRALENILTNALKHAHNKIELGYHIDADQQQIWISDDGLGIPEDDRIIIFEPFKRLDASRARISGGYGLGLAIVKQVSCWHKGNVEVLESLEGGAKIVLSWPSNLAADT